MDLDRQLCPFLFRLHTNSINLWGQRIDELNGADIPFIFMGFNTAKITVSGSKIPRLTKTFSIGFQHPPAQSADKAWSFRERAEALVMCLASCSMGKSKFIPLPLQVFLCPEAWGFITLIIVLVCTASKVINGHKITYCCFICNHCISFYGELVPHFGYPEHLQSNGVIPQVGSAVILFTLSMCTI